LACPKLGLGSSGVRGALRSYLGAEPSTRLPAGSFVFGYLG